jgi:hypothetical protein
MFRMTQAIRPVAPGQIARFEKGKLAFHFLLRAAQPNPADESHGSIIENTLASVTPEPRLRARGCLSEARCPPSILAKTAVQTDFDRAKTQIARKFTAVLRISTSSEMKR